MSSHYNRRAFLVGLTGSSLGLAGCASRGEAGGLTGPTFDSLVSDVSIGSRDVVVELASSDVTEVVLIAPDGTVFDSQQVQTGASTVRFQIIEFDSGSNITSHYLPGTYNLVVVADDSDFRQELSLVPDVQITGVRQYREGNSSFDLARIVFTAKNAGTGPTWVYDATFEDAPNYTANNDLINEPSIPYVELPTSEGDYIMSSGEEQSYLITSNPLAFPETESNYERQFQPFVMQIGIADSSSIETTLIPTYGGNQVALSQVDRVVYSRVGLEIERPERNV